ncbi:MAG TPA: polymer-forming cytoskeletal protein [Verrucomicrobiae bacterium]|nr:polymer-forming cytoskeletal protein [Verrucomicrobiae bacterium]
MWNKKNQAVPLAAAPEPKDAGTKMKSPDAVRSLDKAADLTDGWLGSSLRVKGDISGTEDLLIDGAVEGLIQLDGRKLTVGTTAKLAADINARDVVVYGFVKGNVHATGKIEIKKGGAVTGNLTTAQILIEDGADFRGSIDIDRGAEKEVGKNVSSRSAAAAGSR